VADITVPHLNGIDALVQLKKDDKRLVTMHAEAITRGVRSKPAPSATYSNTRPRLK
jgi:hypothetical protein